MYRINFKVLGWRNHAKWVPTYQFIEFRPVQTHGLLDIDNILQNFVTIFIHCVYIKLLNWFSIRLTKVENRLLYHLILPLNDIINWFTLYKYIQRDQF